MHHYISSLYLLLLFASLKSFPLNPITLLKVESSNRGSVTTQSQSWAYLERTFLPLSWKGWFSAKSQFNSISPKKIFKKSPIWVTGLSFQCQIEGLFYKVTVEYLTQSNFLLFSQSSSLTINFPCKLTC